jgi:hypothetical protein
VAEACWVAAGRLANPSRIFFFLWYFRARRLVSNLLVAAVFVVSFFAVVEQQFRWHLLFFSRL